MSALPSSLSISADTVVKQMPHALWRANQMASFRSAVTSTGFKQLDAELPNGGWPKAMLIELLLQQPGIGEIGLLHPALSVIAKRRQVALVQPPHLPQIAAWTSWDMTPEHLLWVKTKKTADALWTAEQILRNGSCGALLFWQQNIRSEALRRLHLAAQASDTMFWMIRPLSATQDASPAPLRLALYPAPAGVKIKLVKRRGPRREESFYLPMDDMPAPLPSLTPNHHAPVDRRTPALIVSGDISPALV